MKDLLALLLLLFVTIVQSEAKKELNLHWKYTDVPQENSNWLYYNYDDSSWIDGKASTPLTTTRYYRLITDSVPADTKTMVATFSYKFGLIFHLGQKNTAFFNIQSSDITPSISASTSSVEVANDEVYFNYDYYIGDGSKAIFGIEVHLPSETVTSLEDILSCQIVARIFTDNADYSINTETVTCDQLGLVDTGDSYCSDHKTPQGVCLDASIAKLDYTTVQPSTHQAEYFDKMILHISSLRVNLLSYHTVDVSNDGVEWTNIMWFAGLLTLDVVQFPYNLDTKGKPWRYLRYGTGKVLDLDLGIATTCIDSIELVLKAPSVTQTSPEYTNLLQNAYINENNVFERTSTKKGTFTIYPETEWSSFNTKTGSLTINSAVPVLETYAVCTTDMNGCTLLTSNILINYCPSEDVWSETFMNTIDTKDCAKYYSGKRTRLCKEFDMIVTWDSPDETNCIRNSITVAYPEGIHNGVTYYPIIPIQPNYDGPEVTFSGNLPNGLILNAHTGDITGTPTVATDGTQEFEITVTPSVGDAIIIKVSINISHSQCNEDIIYGFPSTNYGSSAFIACTAGQIGNGISRYCGTDGYWGTIQGSCTPCNQGTYNNNGVCTECTGELTGNEQDGYSACKSCVATEVVNNKCEAFTTTNCNTETYGGYVWYSVYRNNYSYNPCPKYYSGNIKRFCEKSSIYGVWRNEIDRSECILMKPALLYSPSMFTFKTYETIHTIVPDLFGDLITLSIVPSLPSGLNFDTTTGIISGTPVYDSNNSGEPVSYTVSITNTNSTSTQTISIRIVDQMCVTNNEWVSTPYGSSVVHFCEDPLVGHITRECSTTGSWNDAISDCTPCLGNTYKNDNVCKECINGILIGDATLGYTGCSLCSQNEVVYNKQCKSTLVCYAELYDDIDWPETAITESVSLPCGRGYQGTSTRVCLKDITTGAAYWGQPEGCIPSSPVIILPESLGPFNTYVPITPIVPEIYGQVESFEIKNLPDGLKYDSSTGIISGIPTTATDGQVIITITVNKGTDNESTISRPITIVNSQCASETYNSIIWPQTNYNESALANCPANHAGYISRKCLTDGNWGTVIDGCYLCTENTFLDNHECKVCENGVITGSDETGNIACTPCNDNEVSINNICVPAVYCNAEDGFETTKEGLTAEKACSDTSIYEGSIIRECIRDTNNNAIWKEVIDQCKLRKPTAIYDPNTYILHIYNQITPIVPITTGKIKTIFVYPSLPSGLTIDDKTGIISGTPTVGQKTKLHDIYLVNEDTYSMSSITLTVLSDYCPPITENGYEWPATSQGSVVTKTCYSGDNGDNDVTRECILVDNISKWNPINMGNCNDDRPFIFYEDNHKQLIQLHTISSIEPTITNINENQIEISVNPSLPTGLQIDSITGVITGTPESIISNQEYMITIKNKDTSLSSNTLLFITVLPNKCEEITIDGYTWPATNIDEIATLACFSDNSISITRQCIKSGNVATWDTINANGCVENRPTIKYDNTEGSCDIYQNVDSLLGTPSINNVSGGDYTISIYPELPQGLIIDPVTGIISGTPTKVVTNKNYIITITMNDNVSMTTSTTITITVQSTYCPEEIVDGYTWPITKGNSNPVKEKCPYSNEINVERQCITANDKSSWSEIDYSKCSDLRPSFSYPTTSVEYDIYITISPLTPVDNIPSNGILSISPSVLPTGLTFDSTTGIISGIPTEAVDGSIYTITLTVDGFSRDISISISILPNHCPEETLSEYTWPVTAANTLVELECNYNKGFSGSRLCSYKNNVATWNEPDLTPCIDNRPKIAYPSDNYEFDIYQQITPILPISLIGENIVLTIEPSLPNGLSFSTHSGIIVGRPIESISKTEYTVTISNQNGKTTTTIYITVNNNYCAKETLDGYEWPSIKVGQSTSVTCSYDIDTQINRSCNLIDNIPTWSNVDSVCTDKRPTISGIDSSYEYIIGVLIKPIIPTINGNGDDHLEISLYPELPSGLQFIPETGAIMGTPSDIVNNQQYILTVGNKNGYVSADFTITVIIPSSETNMCSVTIFGQYSWPEKISGYKHFIECDNAEKTLMGYYGRYCQSVEQKSQWGNTQEQSFCFAHILEDGELLCDLYVDIASYNHFEYNGAVLITSVRGIVQLYSYDLNELRVATVPIIEPESIDYQLRAFIHSSISAKNIIKEISNTANVTIIPKLNKISSSLYSKDLQERTTSHYSIEEKPGLQCIDDINNSNYDIGTYTPYLCNGMTISGFYLNYCHQNQLIPTLRNNKFTKCYPLPIKSGQTDHIDPLLAMPEHTRMTLEFVVKNTDEEISCTDKISLYRLFMKSIHVELLSFDLSYYNKLSGPYETKYTVVFLIETSPNQFTILESLLNSLNNNELFIVSLDNALSFNVESYSITINHVNKILNDAPTTTRRLRGF
ncbi:hypothetical protein WA158_002570 [Blastocystis sp. Blastoise]